MPGISLAVGADLAGEATRARIARLQVAMQHQPSYKSRDILQTDRVFLGYTKYDAYPLALFESDGYHIVVEGLIYNRSPAEIETRLKDIASRLAIGRRVDSEVANWVAGSDGDYIVLMISPDRDHLLFFNDALGRLPCYLYQDSKTFLLSREVKFPMGLRENIKYDRQSMAEMLFFGYPMGNRSLVEDISRIEGGSLLEVDLRTLEVRSTHTYSYNFDECEHAGKPLGQIAGEFKECFVAGCASLNATLGSRPQVISLSGGLDSRAVGAGMKAAGAQIHAGTFQDAGMPSGGGDAVVAEKVAAALGIDWQLFCVEPGNSDSIRRLLLMVDGQNFVGMAFILHFHQAMQDRFGLDMVYYTGHLGDRIMADLRPAWKLKDSDDLLRVVLNRNQRMPFHRVEAVTGVSRRDFRDAVAQRLGEYPEKSLERRYVHFTIAEKLGSLICRSEERDRCFFWYAAPFSLLSVFNYAMNVPQQTKRMHRFYEPFLAALAPQCISVPNKAWHAPFASPRRYLFTIAYEMYSKLPARIRRAIQNRTSYRGHHVEPYQSEYFADCMEGCPLVREYLAEQGVDSLLARRCNRYIFEILLTVAGYIQVNEELRRQVRGGPTPGTLGDPVLEKEQQS